MAETNGQYTGLDFERPIVELERRVAELENFSRKAGVDLSEEIARLRRRSEDLKREIFAHLTPWQRVQLAREPSRPDSMDYVAHIFEDVLELHGDRAFRDDPAIFTALARIEGRPLLLVAQRKGRTTQERMACNFGSPHPEGYRKAIEKMKLAAKARLPVVTFVNTPGAYPGIGAEERGQASLIARNLLEMSRLSTPILSVVLGEGGSGGALAICLADKLAILENAYLSVISPEGCAAILWRDASKAPLAAEVLRLTPRDLERLGIVDEVVPEPLGGSHRDPATMMRTMREFLVRSLDALASVPLDDLLQARYRKFRAIGSYLEWHNPERLRAAAAAAPQDTSSRSTT